MGSAGPIFGFLLYFLVFIAAITSSIALLEAVGPVVMDKQIERQRPNRNLVTLGMGAIVAVEAILISLDGLGSNGFPQFFKQDTWLDAFDLVSEGF